MAAASSIHGSAEKSLHAEEGMTTTNVTDAEVQAGLIFANGAIWKGNITYSIPDDDAKWADGYGDGEPSDAGYGVFNATQATNFGKVMEIWDSYISRSITEVADSKPGEIRVAFADVTARTEGDAAAYAYAPPPPGNSPSAVNGDIWVDASFKSSDFAQNSQDFEILLHEAGHSLGLKHPFEDPTLPDAYENKTYSIMSYTAEDNFYTWHGGGGSIGYKSTGTVDFTPMVLDILAIQDHYGADEKTAAGNTVYAFTDDDLNGRQAIYDAGGKDTIDLSALTRGSTLDMRPGAYSDIDFYSIDKQVQDLSAQYGAGFEDFIRTTLTNGDAYQWERNVGLAFSTLIENAIGSKKADSILGNNAGNTIKGLGGNDTLNGGKGNDTLTGSVGADHFVFSKGGDKDVITDFHAKGADHDTLDLSHLKSVASFADLKANHLERDGTDLVIDGGAGDVITLENVKIKDLHAADFAF
jgi:Ca2+-binding RTX toxin-like protein